MNVGDKAYYRNGFGELEVVTLTSAYTHRSGLPRRHYRAEDGRRLIDRPPLRYAETQREAELRYLGECRESLRAARERLRDARKQLQDVRDDVDYANREIAQTVDRIAQLEEAMLKPPEVPCPPPSNPTDP